MFVKGILAFNFDFGVDLAVLKESLFPTLLHFTATEQ